MTEAGKRLIKSANSGVVHDDLLDKSYCLAADVIMAVDGSTMAPCLEEAQRIIYMALVEERMQTSPAKGNEER